ncbi:YncE family protein [Natrinema versiforme]|uniref:YncE family protein n=1 Tax=Natrinema versiforme TaxID=88724 RepID=A0A4P8WEV6_9EURY|nr:hypothetical protein [Natrinema versiforme]QCS41807.1 hypothetical protein FEJ81_05345 [Natrinema versiforme]
MVQSIDRRRLVQAITGGLAVGVAGCLGGDDDDETNEETDDAKPDEGSAGLAYAFGPDAISLVDPSAGEVVDEITDGVDGYEYGDAVVTADGSQLFAIEETLSQVLAIDLEAREIAAEIGMGPGGTHMYHPTDDEMWAHSDTEGTFYVIDTDSHEVIETVEAGLDGEGHGKLLSHPELGDTGYATNVNDPALHVVDLEAYERTDTIELGEDGGTHYKAYSPANGFAYVEYGDVTAVVDTETDAVVDELDVAGGMYLTPDEERMAIVDHGAIHAFDVTGDETTAIGSVTIEGGPDDLEYYRADDTLYGFTANTMDDDSVVVDMDALEAVDRIEVGDIERPAGAQHLHRSAVSGDGYFITPADAEGTVAVIDMADREPVAQVEVGDGVGTVAYVPE